MYNENTFFFFFMIRGILFVYSPMWRNKKQYIILGGVLLGACFLFMPHVGLAADSGWGPAAALGTALKGAVSWLLYQIFILVTWIATAAIALFGFAIDTDLVSGTKGLLNRSVIYELWQFIRDFFNIFFIFMLLIGAFSMVFQLEQYNAKKTLLKIILAALLINFSFPIARVMIDAANVPMYFFAQQIVSTSKSDGVVDAFQKSSLGATKISNILLPPDGKGGHKYEEAGPAKLIIAIVFMFIFAISLAVLAVMFVIRLTMLVVLVIFSPVAFVSLFPGIKEHSDKWWKEFTKYVLFGPSAMLMLLVTVRFMDAIGQDDWYKQAEAAAGKAAGAGDGMLVAQQFILLSIPMIMIWITLSLSSQASLKGAGMVEGWGKKALGWGKKAAMGTGMALVPNNYLRGAKKGIQERIEGSSFKLLTSKGRADQAKAMEARGMNRFGGDKVKKAFKDKQVNEKLEEHKKNRTSASAREEDLKSKDDATRRAAALSLAETKDIDTANRLAGSLKAVSDNTEQFKKVVNAADRRSLNMSTRQFAETVGKEDANGNFIVDTESEKFKVLSSKMKKEGNIKTLIDYYQSAAGGGMTSDKAYKEVVGKMNDKSIVGIDVEVLKDAGFQQYVASDIATHPQKFQKIMYSDEMSNENFQEWAKMAQAAGINAAPAGSTP